MPSVREIAALLGRYTAPEREFAIPWTAATTLQSPSSLKTDKFISFIVLRWRGRITSVNAHAVTLPDAVRNLVQQVRIFGTHVQYGAQTPFRMFAKTASDLMRISYVGYVPNDTGAVLPNPTVMGATYDMEVVWTLPVFPMGVDLNKAPLYSLKGPDWAGNLFIEIDTGDSTSIGGAIAADDTFTAFGSALGNPTLFVSVIRPALTVDMMNKISPAITFRTERVLDALVNAAGATGANLKLSDLNIGKKHCGAALVTGTTVAAPTAGTRALATLIDTVVTRAFVSLDGKSVPLEPYSNTETNEFAAAIGKRAHFVGYQLLPFVFPTGNADAAFDAETLTAARRFEIDGDVAGAATQTLSVVQEELLGQPSIS